MNALLELLAETSGPLDMDDVRAATAASLKALRHDTRVRPERDVSAVDQLCIAAFRDNAEARGFEHWTNELQVDVIEREAAGLLQPHAPKLLFELLHSAHLHDPAMQPNVDTDRASGQHLRVAATPFRMCLYHRRLAVLPVDFENNQAGAYVVTEPELVGSLIALHRRIWLDAKPVAPASGRRIKVQLLDVLAELRSGRSDEAAARRLAISLRTYRRRVEELMQALGCDSRFQAGLAAAEHGLAELVA
jgi:hypothetical protein